MAMVRGRAGRFDRWRSTTPAFLLPAIPLRLPLRLLLLLLLFLLLFLGMPTAIGADRPVAPSTIAEPLVAAYAGEPYAYAPLDGAAGSVEIVDGPAGISAAGGAVRWTPVPADVGMHRVALRVTDASGSATVVVFAVEVLPARSPSVAVLSPPGARVHSTLTVSGITAGQPGAPVTAVEYRIGAGNWSPATGTGRWTIRQDVTELEDGPHLLEVRGWSGSLASPVVGWEFVVENPRPSFAVVTAVIPLTAILLGIGALMVSEPARFRLITLFLIPIYTRLHRESLLDNFTRGQIYQHVRANPGDNFQAIRRTLGLPNGTLTYHLMVLEREGFVRSRRRSIWKHFYPADFPVPRVIFRLTPVQKDMIESIRKAPGITQRALAKEIGVSPNTIAYHMGRLTPAGLVRTSRAGTATNCYLTGIDGR